MAKLLFGLKRTGNIVHISKQIGYGLIMCDDGKIDFFDLKQVVNPDVLKNNSSCAYLCCGNSAYSDAFVGVLKVVVTSKKVEK